MVPSLWPAIALTRYPRLEAQSAKKSAVSKSLPVPACFGRSTGDMRDCAYRLSERVGIRAK